jgi:hypothetical protein
MSVRYRRYRLAPVVYRAASSSGRWRWWSYVVFPDPQREREYKAERYRLSQLRPLRLVYCIDCGINVITNQSGRKRCPGCNLLTPNGQTRIRSRQRRYRPAVCIDCGEPFIAHVIQRRCPQCQKNFRRAEMAKQHTAEKQREHYRKRRTDPGRWARTLQLAREYRRRRLRDPVRHAAARAYQNKWNRVQRQLLRSLDPSTIERAVLAQLEQIGVVPASEEGE